MSHTLQPLDVVGERVAFSSRWPPFFLSPLHLFVLPALTQSLSPLQRRDSGAGCDLFFSFPSFFFWAFHLFPLSQTSKISPNKKVVGAYRGLASFTYLVTKMHEKLI